MKTRRLLKLAGFCLMMAGTYAQAGTTTVLAPVNSEIIESGKLPSESSRSAAIDFGLSSWAPSGVTLPSQIGNGVAFQRSMPAVYANYVFQVLSQTHDLNAKLGLNWVSLSRSAPFNFGGAGGNSSQSMQLFSLRVGVEYTPTFLKTNAVETYAALSFLPSAAVTGASTFERGSTYFGFPGELALGARLKMSAVGISWEAASFDLGVLGTLGKLHDSNINGIGLTAGLKVVL